MPVPNTLIVSEAGVVLANGTYVQGADQNGYPAWYKTGAQIRAEQVNSVPLAFAWFITGDPQIGGGPGLNVWYTSQGKVVAEFEESPAGLTINTVYEQFAPAPTVTGAAPGPNCADPLERCAFAVGGESGRSRFRRLYALGYV